MKKIRRGMAVSLFLALGLFLSGQAESVLNFPRMANEAGRYTDFAIASPTEQTAEITVTTYSVFGLLESDFGGLKI